MKRFVMLFCLLSTGAFCIELKSLFTYTFDENKHYDLEKAKDLYFKKKCDVCHGIQGEKQGVGKKALKDMSASDLKAKLIAYSLGADSTSSSQMSFYAKNLSHKQMDEIIAYIKGGNLTQDQQLSEQEIPKKTKYGTFIQ